MILMKLVDLFFEEVEETISRLRAAENLKQLEQDLHFLKGSATNLGFSTFSELCQDGERVSASGHAKDVDVPAIIEEFEKSKKVFLVTLTDTQEP